MASSEPAVGKSISINLNKSDESPLTNVSNIGATEDLTQLQNSLTKLTVHLKNDKKFNRAVLILINLLNDALSRSNNSLFYDCIIEFISESERDPLDTKYKSFYSDLFDTINTKLNIFTSQQIYRLNTFSLYCHARNKLITDDSFQFNQAIKTIEKVIENENSYSNNKENTSDSEYGDNFDDDKKESNISPSSDEIIERQKVLLLTLEVACKNYKWNWAKQSIEALIQTCCEKRQKFHSDMIPELDEITERILLKKRKESSVLTSGGSRKTVLTANALAHPLFVKRSDVIL